MIRALKNDHCWWSRGAHPQKRMALNWGALKWGAMIPLRAVHDATAGLDRSGVDLHGHSPEEFDRTSREVVNDVIQHIVEGDYPHVRVPWACC